MAQGINFMLICQRLIFLIVVLLFCLLTILHFSLSLPPLTAEELGKQISSNQVTMRVNSFRRLDLLEFFLDYYKTCDVVNQIQVVWSDQQNKPPLDWLSKYPNGKVVFEVHAKNSLNNRFIPLQEIRTDAVLSIDDDLIIPCQLVQESLEVWNTFPNALVGYSPRMIGWDTTTGNVKYLRWQHTWWSGLYSIMLTKITFLHKQYLNSYKTDTPPAFLEHVDRMRNCEDVAMAHLVATKTHAAPVWVDGAIYEVSEKGISSGSSHFSDRSMCVGLLQNLTNSWPWVTGRQKVSKMSFWDGFRLSGNQ